MSADGYEECPFCKKTPEKLEDFYGKISMEEYEEKKAELESKANTVDKTVRLDYDVCIDDGELYVSAKACCTNCGASASLYKSVKLRAGNK